MPWKLVRAGTAALPSVPARTVLSVPVSPTRALPPPTTDGSVREESPPDQKHPWRTFQDLTLLGHDLPHSKRGSKVEMVDCVEITLHRAWKPRVFDSRNHYK